MQILRIEVDHLLWILQCMEPELEPRSNFCAWAFNEHLSLGVSLSHSHTHVHVHLCDDSSSAGRPHSCAEFCAVDSYNLPVLLHLNFHIFFLWEYSNIIRKSKGGLRGKKHGITFTRIWKFGDIVSVCYIFIWLHLNFIILSGYRITYLIFSCLMFIKSIVIFIDNYAFWLSEYGWLCNSLCIISSFGNSWYA